jgi:sugar/nucleoside kinase (ribokinase family)
MLTFLGAASEAQPQEITEKCFEDAVIVHIEGYLLFNEDLIMAALKGAKAAGARVSLDLASFTVVEASKTFLKKIVKDFVDILIANEDEAKTFTGHGDETKAMRSLSDSAQIAALKVGERGSFISHDGKIINIEAMGSGAAVDTTGAGDLWASGFLFGLVNGYGLEKCGNLGSACGYEVCQVVGANIPEQGWLRIKKLLEE